MLVLYSCVKIQEILEVLVQMDKCKKEFLINLFIFFLIQPMNFH